MPLTDHQRLSRASHAPRLVALQNILTQLTSTLSFMNTGAHPDDETTAMLAILVRKFGYDVSIACSTRGEGGQNVIGRESGAGLGVLRTAEMERAAAALDFRMYWHCQSPDDTITDFGFSKSGEETLKKWGKDRTIARFVDILRQERPDIICPTFLDVPGQHGHHRAMTQTAFDAFEAAADPSYRGSDLPVWEVKKLYLPAWSGAGLAYDDDVPPPPETSRIKAQGWDPVTGMSYENLGEISRACHATQGMGRWFSSDKIRDFPLHLAASRVDGADGGLAHGLVSSLDEFGVAQLEMAQIAIEAAQQSLLSPKLLIASLTEALTAVRQAITAPELAHKLARKETQLSRALRLATGVAVHAELARDILLPDDRADMIVDSSQALADNIQVSVDLPEHWSQDGTAIVTRGAPVSDPYPDTWLPEDPAKPRLKVDVTTGDVTSTTYLPFDTPPLVAPKSCAEMTPVTAVINLQDDRRVVDVELDRIAPAGATPVLDLPNGWTQSETATGLQIAMPETAASGLYELPLLLDGQPAKTLQLIEHDHVDPRLLAQDAVLKLRIADIALPQARIAYLGGGHDRVDHWMAQIGLDVTALTGDITGDVLSDFDTIVIGIFAIRSRSLANLMPVLHDWVENGGTLVTLYHRPWDDWDATKTAPKPLEIGQPSLRWRVTDETAEVTYLAPDHPALTAPNQITSDDWQDWHKERGLYFAKSWDAAYQPLLQMSDPGEDPHQGALLVADIGKGRHVHCALILHHQMEHLVPGAFRLMANLVTPRTT